MKFGRKKMQWSYTDTESKFELRINHQVFLNHYLRGSHIVSLKKTCIDVKGLDCTSLQDWNEGRNFY